MTVRKKVSLSMFMLNFHSCFQYQCCLKFDIRKERMAHIFSHYIQTDIKQIRENFKQFAFKNSAWISKVGIDVLHRSQLTTDQYIKNIFNGTIPFDELAVLVTCRIYNIHCVILLKNSYWTTRPKLMFNDCVLRLAYCGDFTFKEISAELADELSPTSHSGNESGDEDLQGTGLLNNDTDNYEETDDNEQSIEKQVHGDQHQTQELDNVDVKPPVLAKFRFAHETIEISSDSDNGDVPDKQDNGLEADNDDCILDRVVPPKFYRISRERNCGCYLCLETFEMQQSFVTHFQDKHPELPFRCEFCSSDFQSPNGLFKHKCSHEYLKYKCIACNKKFQFPYQLKAHKSIHTGLDRYQCGLCDKDFSTKCARDFHQKSHGVEIACELCPVTTSKRFSNDVALSQHKRGMHGEGWTSHCGDHFKWKSQYTKHMGGCKRCMKYRADKQMVTYNFLHKMDLTNVKTET